MTETKTAADLVRLPHTGLRVPDTSLRVTAYRGAETGKGLAYTANLWTGGAIVGTIENDGQGGLAFFRPTHQRTYGDDQLAAYAERCRTEEGDDVYYEWLLEMLISEHQWARDVVDTAVKGKLLLRKMGFPMSTATERADYPPTPQAAWDTERPTRDIQWTRLTCLLQLKHKPGPHAWWQAWDKSRWRDVTPRPEGVDAELYG